MKRDLVKSIAGVIVVGLVVVATFLYGNHQSQLQQQKDQEAKQSQQSASSSTTPAQTPAPAPAPAKTPAPAPQPVATSQTGSNGNLPQTGGLEDGLVPALAIVGVAWLYVRSRRDLRLATLTS